MKKILLLLVPVLLLLTACPKAPEDEPIKEVKVKYNIFGLTGRDSTKAYIELFYTRLNSSGVNEVVREWVKPPYEFGDHHVNIEAQKVYYKGHSNIFRYEIFPKFDQGEACYVKIINHSNHPIEYFIAGTQNAYVGDCREDNKSMQQGCDCSLGISSYFPRPIYKNAPTYYLLHPDKKINLSNLQIIKYNSGPQYSCFETGISYKDNQVGEISLNKPFSIEEVMKLYSSEYSGSKDTIMYKRIENKFSGSRLKNSSTNLQPGHVVADVYYGKIAPNSTFNSSLKTPVINLPSDESFNNKIILDNNREPEKW